MTRWGMLADLERCVGCQTCTAACRHTNATSPAVQWRKVIDVEAGTFPNVSRTFVPVGCQHCADPPCMHVCPTTATRQRDDGIVTIDYSICIGCAYCEVACPYQARFLVDEPHYAYEGAAMQNEIERADEERIGVAQKCTFCSDRIDFGLENGLTPGLDPRATPACVNACIADALHFGDLDDPNSNVSRLLQEHKSFKMHAELGTEPGFHYLYGRAGDGVETPPAYDLAGGGHLRAKGAEPALQQHWNWKAAGNFICGGMGAGLLLGAMLAMLAGVPATASLGWAALGLIAVGLTVLLFKIGRPLRFIHVLRQPQRSWMTREAWIAGALFPIAAAALWTGLPWLLAIAVVLAAAFLVSQAMILYGAKGIPAWRHAAIIPLIVVTGLAEGCGLFLADAAFRPKLASVVAIMALATGLLAAARALAWRAYTSALTRAGAPAQSLDVLVAHSPALLLGGTLLPLVLLGAATVFASAAPFLNAVAGLCIAIAGAETKLIIVTRAGFNQGFAIAHTPVRGAGSAGPGVKPGWVFGKTM
jgi:phenylacetyl-CoA:acceptor oxidoreductase subunit 1